MRTTAPRTRVRRSPSTTPSFTAFGFPADAALPEPLLLPQSEQPAARNGSMARRTTRLRMSSRLDRSPVVDPLVFLRRCVPGEAGRRPRGSHVGPLESPLVAEQARARGRSRRLVARGNDQAGSELAHDLAEGPHVRNHSGPTVADGRREHPGRVELAVREHDDRGLFHQLGDLGLSDEAQAPFDAVPLLRLDGIEWITRDDELRLRDLRQGSEQDVEALVVADQAEEEQHLPSWRAERLALEDRVADHDGVELAEL